MAESKINLITSWSRIWLETYYEELFPYQFTGACMVASAYILKQLNEHNINSHVNVSHLGEGYHAFVETDDYIIDITAQQFQDKVDRYIPDTIVMDKTKRKEYFWHNVSDRLRSIPDIMNYVEQYKWPEWQQPNLILMETMNDI